MAKVSDKANLSDLEKSVIKVAGDNSKKWYVNDFLQVLVQNGVKLFGDDSKHLTVFLRRRPHLFDFQDDKLSTKFNSEEIRKLRAQQNEDILKSMSDLEKSVIKVAGDSSKKWNINDFIQVLVQNGVKQFRDDSKHLANFLRRRPHLIDFQNDKLSTKFNSEEIRKLSVQQNEDIVKSMATELQREDVLENDSNKKDQDETIPEETEQLKNDFKLLMTSQNELKKSFQDLMNLVMSQNQNKSQNEQGADPINENSRHAEETDFNPPAKKIRLKDQNEDIQRLNQVIKDLENDNSKLSSENGKLSKAIEDYKDLQEQNDKVVKNLKEELLKLDREIADLKCKPK